MQTKGDGQVDYFKDAVEWVLEQEGGYVNDPKDQGGATNHGITLVDLAHFRKDPSLGVQAIKDLSVAEAQEIYRQYYWTPLGLDKVKSRLAAICILDQAVNRGVHRVVDEIQTVLNASGATLSVDGLMGASTLEALNSLNESTERAFVVRFIILAKAMYVRIVTRDPTQLEFLAGWDSRTSQLLSLLI